MPALGDEHMAALRAYARQEHDRVGDDAALGATGEGELRGLRDIFAEHEAGLELLPQAGGLQGLHRRLAIGRMLWVGDGEARDTTRAQRLRQSLELGVECEIGYARRDQRDATRSHRACRRRG